MGADGHITIWDREKAVEKFPEADKLFELLPNCYRETIFGKVIYHAYHGDNMSDDWRALEDWSTSSPSYPVLERQREFFFWLQQNREDEWEVWT